MEIFSFRKLTDARATTIVTTVPCFSGETNLTAGDASDDEGPFYDLEFAVPLESGDLSSSPPFLTKQMLFSPAESKSQFPASVLKSATKLRIFIFPPSSKPRPNPSDAAIKVLKEEKRVYTDVILRYFRKIKPLYVKVSKLRFYSRNREGCVGHETGGSKKRKTIGSSIPFRFQVVPGRLRKSRSASSAVASVISPPTMTPRRDDSLLQHEDGIQAAIAHCKRSFHSEKELWNTELPLLRSMSDPGGKRSAGNGRRQGGVVEDDSTV